MSNLNPPVNNSVLSVSSLNRLVRDCLESAFPLTWVGGEISNLTYASSGHVYFSLKDSNAQVRCVMWRSRAQLQHRPWPQRQMRCANRALADPCQQASRRNFIVALHGAHCVPSVHEAGAINALNVLALCESVRSHLQNV